MLQDVLAAAALLQAFEPLFQLTGFDQPAEDGQHVRQPAHVGGFAHTGSRLPIDFRQLARHVIGA
jgi:hypothetical protein